MNIEINKFSIGEHYMKNEQMAIIVNKQFNSRRDDTTNSTNNLVELNSYLKDGWKVISSTPMGAYGYGRGDYTTDVHGFASLVILEKNQDD
jgi:hypothetical protein